VNVSTQPNIGESGSVSGGTPLGQDIRLEQNVSFLSNTLAYYCVTVKYDHVELYKSGFAEKHFSYLN
jgi:hypothetical protein